MPRRSTNINCAIRDRPSLATRQFSTFRPITPSPTQNWLPSIKRQTTKSPTTSSLFGARKVYNNRSIALERSSKSPSKRIRNLLTSIAPSLSSKWPSPPTRHTCPPSSCSPCSMPQRRESSHSSTCCKIIRIRLATKSQRALAP